MSFEDFPKFQKGAIGKETSIETEAKEKEKTDIEKIENLNSLGAQDRMNLILTYLEEKPVSEIEIYYDEQNPIAELEDTLLTKNALEVELNKIGLKFKAIEQAEINEDGFEQKKFQFLVGKKEKDIEELEGALLKNNNEKIGELLGYPETAVKAFAQGIKQRKIFELMLDEKEWWRCLSQKEKEGILQEGVLNFVPFKCSKKHWKEELEVVRKWQAQIKEKAPGLYATIIKEKPLVAMSKTEEIKWEKEQAAKQLKDVREKIERIANQSGKPLEKKIKEVVILLNAFNIRTTASCEGRLQKTRDSHQKQSVIAPYIVIKSKISEMKNWEENEQIKERAKKQNKFFYAKTMRLLKLFYKNRKAPAQQKLHLKITDSYGAFRLENHLKNFLYAQNQKEQLHHCQKEMAEFAAFLKKNYSAYLFYHTLEN